MPLFTYVPLENSVSGSETNRVGTGICTILFYIHSAIAVRNDGGCYSDMQIDPIEGIRALMHEMLHENRSCKRNLDYHWYLGENFRLSFNEKPRSHKFFS